MSVTVNWCESCGCQHGLLCPVCMSDRGLLPVAAMNYEVNTWSQCNRRLGRSVVLNVVNDQNQYLGSQC